MTICPLRDERTKSYPPPSPSPHPCWSGHLRCRRKEHFLLKKIGFAFKRSKWTFFKNFSFLFYHFVKKSNILYGTIYNSVPFNLWIHFFRGSSLHIRFYCKFSLPFDFVVKQSVFNFKSTILHLYQNYFFFCFVKCIMNEIKFHLFTFLNIKKTIKFNRH